MAERPCPTRVRHNVVVGNVLVDYRLSSTISGPRGFRAVARRMMVVDRDGRAGERERERALEPFLSKGRVLRPRRTIPRRTHVRPERGTASSFVRTVALRARCLFSSFPSRTTHPRESERRRRSQLSPPSSPTPTRYTFARSSATTPLHAECQWCSTGGSRRDVRRRIENPVWRRRRESRSSRRD